MSKIYKENDARERETYLWRAIEWVGIEDWLDHDETLGEVLY